MISSTIPCWVSTTTVSPIRTVSLKAICSPAKKLPSVPWAAMPATTLMIPAEASRLVPMVRAAEKVSSITATVTTAISALTTRRSMEIWVRTRCSRAGSPAVVS